MNNFDFRFWDKKEQKMIYSEEVSSIGVEDSYINYYGMEQVSDTEWEQAQFICTDFELMQYTGLLDKNDNKSCKVYEHDLLTDGTGNIYKVEWSCKKAGWCAIEQSILKKYNLVKLLLDYAIVIGNKFAKPELIKEQMMEEFEKGKAY